jgi:hypothetical protein
MDFLLVFAGLALLPLFLVVGRVRSAIRSLLQTAQQNEGFAMRRPSLSPSEWRAWNAEFLRWRFYRASFWLGVAEGLLLALALQRLGRLPALLLWVQLFQLLPFLLVYALHLWLLYRVGRFNLRRFDPAQEVSRQLVILLVACSAWVPLVTSWLFFAWMGTPAP